MSRINGCPTITMNTAAPASARFEFTFPRTRTLVLAEIHEAMVVIRATRPSFNLPQQTAFVQHLMAEGFIPDHIRNEICPEPVAGGVQWVIDDDWLDHSETVAAKARRILTSAICGSGLIWAAFIAFLFLRD